MLVNSVHRAHISIDKTDTFVYNYYSTNGEELKNECCFKKAFLYNNFVDYGMYTLHSSRFGGFAKAEQDERERAYRVLHNPFGEKCR